MRKRFALLLTALMLLLSLTAAAGTAVVEPTEALYVADYANVLSADTENHIVTASGSLKTLCGGEIAVVTIDYLNDLDAEEYAYELINQWGVGDSDKQNGCVFLLV
ncbi:MAG: TPM domain-containing protein, partial [Oscillospiraceae bacterium]|nr:TPM domain-containing protein [Oscillospiraceae bacterium]